jgi:hypothetical protein
MRAKQFGHRTDQILSNARRNTGTLGTATEASRWRGALGCARRGPTTARLLASQLGIVGRTFSSAADAAGLGGIAGFNEGNSLRDRASIGQGARRHVPNAGKERHIPEAVVEIDFWRG